MEKPIQRVITERTSRRSYESSDLSREILEKISSILQSSSKGPLGTEINFELIQKYSDANKKLKLGTYGFISGSRHFIIGQIVPDKIAFIDYGYLLEKIILECTDLQLGTCWLGGTFDRGEFAKTINLGPGMVIPAITPVGYSTANRSLSERVIRFGAGSRNRKAWEMLFFDSEPGNPLKAEAIDKETFSILEMVRMAPSASNNQPWRIILRNGQFDFYLHRKPGYGSSFKNVDLQMMDMGIAISHCDLTAKDLGKSPEWTILEDPQVTEGWEYIISANF